MASDLQVFPISMPGGINQSAPDPTESDLEELENFGIFRNRVGLRPPITLIATLQTDVATDVDEVIDIVDHEGKLWTLSWSLAQTDVYLHSMQVDGTSLTLEAVVHTSVSTVPTLKMVSFTGGTAASGVSRLYISDYDQNLDTKFWNGSSITTLTEDLDNNSSAENIKFSLMIDYKFHLWGTGFFEGTVERPEMIRFTQPGAIPGTDEAGGTNPKEWFSADHRSVGRRGDKVVALSKAGDRLLLFQKRATHAIYGSGFQTWTRQELSDVTGCVGPHAVASVDERVAYFWASDGPYRTDGNSLQYLGDPIRQIVVEVDASEADTRVGYSPDDGLVYYIVSPGGANSYHLALVFDTRQNRWMKSVWLIGTSTEAEFGAIAFLDSAAAPGPAGAPSSPAAVATSDTTIDVTWVNGDVNVNTETHVYRSTSSGFTPNDATNRVGTLDSGVVSFTDTGRTTVTEYFYKIRHQRNSSHSSESSEVSDTTWLAEPSSTGLAGLTDGLTVSGTNNASGADIRIERGTDPTTFALVTTLSAPGGTFSHPDTGLVCGTVYYYRTRAEKVGETNSEWSTTINRAACAAATSPTAPSAFSATTVSTSQIDLAWTDNSDNEDRFEVFRSTDGGTVYSLLTTLTPETVTYEDTGLDSNTEFFYKVRASNSVGDSAFTTADSDTTTPSLVTPSDLAAVTISISQIDLTWTDTADDDESWEVHQSSTGSGGSYSLVATLGAGSTSHSATGLSATQEYHYKVRPVNGVTNGSFSNIDNATTLGAPPTAPTMTSVIKDAGSPTDTIDIIWVDNSSDEEGFEIQRDSGGGFVVVDDTLVAGTQAFEDTGLSAGTNYAYRVRALHATNGDSVWSATANDTTDGAASAPTAPSNIVGVPNDSDLGGVEVSEVNVSWDDNSDDEDTFHLERCTGASCSSFIPIATLGAGVTSYVDSGVTDNATAATIYRYRILARNGTGDSAYATSADISVEPQVTPSSVVTTDTGHCELPDEFIAVPALTATWNQGDVTGLVSRTVQRSQDSGSTWSTVVVISSSPAATTSYQDLTVNPGTFYSYRVIDDHGSSGENTGTFTSSGSNIVQAGLPNCSES